ncbi:MAG TPA: hypothetical protein GX711_04220, partial [Clostridia bacterium]|nr:hypothetical protein [Clostridia bacterium]
PRLLVNPLDCRELGLSPGEMVEAYNHRGSCLFYLEESHDLPRGLVAAPGVWWAYLSPGGRNVNCLMGDDLTDLGEGSTFYDHRVNLRSPKQDIQPSTSKIDHVYLTELFQQ